MGLRRWTGYVDEELRAATTLQALLSTCCSRCDGIYTEDENCDTCIFKKAIDECINYLKDIRKHTKFIGALELYLDEVARHKLGEPPSQDLTNAYITLTEKWIHSRFIPTTFYYPKKMVTWCKDAIETIPEDIRKVIELFITTQRKEIIDAFIRCSSLTRYLKKDEEIEITIQSKLIKDFIFKIIFTFNTILPPIGDLSIKCTKIDHTGEHKELGIVGHIWLRKTQQ